MPANADGLRDRFLGKVRDGGQVGSERTAQKMRDRASRRSGDLAGAITEPALEENPTTLRWTLRCDVEYASYQDEGTGIYGPLGRRIYPRKPGGVLVFDWPAGGGIVFARSVAGSEPTRFFSVPRDEWLDEVRAAYDVAA